MRLKTLHSLAGNHNTDIIIIRGIPPRAERKNIYMKYLSRRAYNELLLCEIQVEGTGDAAADRKLITSIIRKAGASPYPYDNITLYEDDLEEPHTFSNGGVRCLDQLKDAFGEKNVEVSVYDPRVPDEPGELVAYIRAKEDNHEQTVNRIEIESTYGAALKDYKRLFEYVRDDFNVNTTQAVSIANTVFNAVVMGGNIPKGQMD